MIETNRRTVIEAGLLGFGVAANQAVAGFAFAASQNRKADTAYQTALDDVLEFAQDHAKRHGLPALIISLADRSGWKDQIFIGSANLPLKTEVKHDHLFQIGSISKSITALCIFTLVAEGRLSLATPISNILLTLTIASAEPITVQHLINHSSGLPGDSPLSRAFAENRIVTKNRPGAHWNYSNLAYQLLGLMIEQVAQRPFAKVLHDKIFAPLAMTATKGAILQNDRRLYATGYGPLYPDRPFPVQAQKTEAPWVNMTAASGSVASTAADMSRYLHYLLTMGSEGSEALLPTALARQFVASTTKAPGWEAGAEFANGLAIIRRDGRPLLHHTGGMIAFSSAVHLDRLAGVAAFASTNVGHQSYRPNAVTEFACRRLRALSEQKAFALPAAVPKPRAADRYLGEFSSQEGSTVSVRIDHENLLLTDGTTRINFSLDGEGYYIAVDPSQTADSITINPADANPARLWWGDSQYVRAGTTFLEPTIKTAALVGRYENDDPWFGLVRVQVRGGRIMLNGTTELFPSETDSFRLGNDPQAPEYARFHGFIENRPQFLDISGVTYTRRDFGSGAGAV